MQSISRLKRHATLCAALLSHAPPLTVLSQGTVFFNTRFGEASAFVYDLETRQLCSGTNYLAQLYVGAAGSSERSLAPALGDPTFFRSGALAGHISGGIRVAPGVPPRSPAVAQIRVWTSYSGATFEQAIAAARANAGFGHRLGVSSLVNISRLGDDPTNSFAYLDGLNPFAVGRYPYSLSYESDQDRFIPLWSGTDLDFALEPTRDLNQAAWEVAYPPETGWQIAPGHYLTITNTPRRFFRIRRK
jgi:hypothetical protein